MLFTALLLSFNVSAFNYKNQNDFNNEGEICKNIPQMVYYGYSDYSFTDSDGVPYLIRFAPGMYKYRDRIGHKDYEYEIYRNGYLFAYATFKSGKDNITYGIVNIIAFYNDDNTSLPIKFPIGKSYGTTTLYIGTDGYIYKSYRDMELGNRSWKLKYTKKRRC